MKYLQCPQTSLTGYKLILHTCNYGKIYKLNFSYSSEDQTWLLCNYMGPLSEKGNYITQNLISMSVGSQFMGLLEAVKCGKYEVVI